MTGHDLARALIAKHGVDRYPGVERQALKVLEEMGELARALLRSGDPKNAQMAAIRKEYADAGLALYALGDKLGLDLDAEMAAVVDGETRTFAPEADR